MKSKKNQKSVTGQAAKKKDRAKYRCPAKLARLIDLVNSIPPDRELPKREELETDAGRDEDRIVEILEEKLYGVPLDFLDEFSLREGYDQFRAIRQAVHDMAQIGQVYPKRRERFENTLFDSVACWTEALPADAASKRNP